MGGGGVILNEMLAEEISCFWRAANLKLNKNKNMIDFEIELI